MRRYKVHEVIDLLHADGWVLDRIRGDHRQYVHEKKPGIHETGNTEQYLETGRMEIIVSL